MKFDTVKIVLAVTALLLPATAQAGSDSNSPVDSGEYYYGFDESNLQREILDIRQYYAVPVALEAESDELQADYVYFGAGGGFAGLWIPAASVLSGGGGPNLLPEWIGDVRFGVDWRPEVSGGESAGARRIGRSLTGQTIDHVGVRADVTAMLFDDNGAGTTAWRVTGALGSTSLSLVPNNPLPGDAAGSEGGLLWDIGVGWTSGSVSLSAGYQSATSPVKGSESDIAVLSLGADYMIIPGLSVYGEFNVIDDPAALGDNRLGTVIIVGTGLNF